MLKALTPKQQEILTAHVLRVAVDAGLPATDASLYFHEGLNPEGIPMYTTCAAFTVTLLTLEGHHPRAIGCVVRNFDIKEPREMVREIRQELSRWVKRPECPF